MPFILKVSHLTEYDKECMIKQSDIGGLDFLDPSSLCAFFLQRYCIECFRCDSSCTINFRTYDAVCRKCGARESLKKLLFQTINLTINDEELKDVPLIRRRAIEISCINLPLELGHFELTDSPRSSDSCLQVIYKRKIFNKRK